MKNIIVANNQWSNIGNAFFANNIADDLRIVFGDKANVMWGEGPSFYKLTPWSGRNDSFMEYGLSMTADWFVVDGPVFHRELPEVWGPILRNLKARGTKICFMSAGSNNYDDEEREICRRFLDEIQPHLLITRDSETYEAYKDHVAHAYDGICSAFYSPFHFAGWDTPDLDPYLVWGFEHATEPKLIASNGSLDGLRIEGRNSVKKLGTAGLMADNLRKYPSEVGGFKLVRPWHHPFSKAALMAYNRPNTFVTSNPYAYLNLFRNAEATISQRVHGCVPALAYGRPATLVYSTKRSKLFSRVGLDKITEEMVTFPRERLEAEREGFMNFMRSVPL